MDNDRSLVVFDVKGELAAQTARTRSKLSDVKIINPYGVLGVPSDGYNPLAVLGRKRTATERLLDFRALAQFATPCSR